MKIIKLGDTVKISKKSPFYKKNDQSNPTDIYGKVLRAPKDGISLNENAYVYYVKWDNKRENSYRIIDLVAVKREK